MRGDKTCACGNVLLKGVDLHDPEVVSDRCAACHQADLFAALDVDGIELAKEALHEHQVLGARVIARGGALELVLSGLSEADVELLSKRLRCWMPEEVRRSCR